MQAERPSHLNSSSLGTVPQLLTPPQPQPMRRTFQSTPVAPPRYMLPLLGATIAGGPAPQSQANSPTIHTGSPQPVPAVRPESNGIERPEGSSRQGGNDTSGGVAAAETAITLEPPDAAAKATGRTDRLAGDMPDGDPDVAGTPDDDWSGDSGGHGAGGKANDRAELQGAKRPGQVQAGPASPTKRAKLMDVRTAVVQVWPGPRTMLNDTAPAPEAHCSLEQQVQPVHHHRMKHQHHQERQQQRQQLSAPHSSQPQDARARTAQPSAKHRGHTCHGEHTPLQANSPRQQQQQQLSVLRFSQTQSHQARAQHTQPPADHTGLTQHVAPTSLHHSEPRRQQLQQLSATRPSQPQSLVARADRAQPPAKHTGVTHHEAPFPLHPTRPRQIRQELSATPHTPATLPAPPHAQSAPPTAATTASPTAAPTYTNHAYAHPSNVQVYSNNAHVNPSTASGYPNNAYVYPNNAYASANANVNASASAAAPPQHGHSAYQACIPPFAHPLAGTTPPGSANAFANISWMSQMSTAAAAIANAANANIHSLQPATAVPVSTHAPGSGAPCTESPTAHHRYLQPHRRLPQGAKVTEIIEHSEGDDGDYDEGDDGDHVEGHDGDYDEGDDGEHDEDGDVECDEDEEADYD